MLAMAGVTRVDAENHGFRGCNGYRLQFTRSTAFGTDIGKERRASGWGLLR